MLKYKYLNLMYKYFKTTWVPVQVPSTTSPWPQNFWLALRFVHIFYTLKRRTQLIGVYCKTWNSWMHSNFANWLNSQNLIPANPVSNWTLELPLQLCLTNFPVNMGVATGGISVYICRNLMDRCGKQCRNLDRPLGW